MLFCNLVVFFNYISVETYKVIMSKILLLSYPRSGNSLVKYFIKRSIKATTVHDCIYQRSIKYNKTIDFEWKQNQLKIGNVLFKEHFYKNCNSFDPNIDSLVFVVRNYKECIFRHNKKRALNDVNFRKSEMQKYLGNVKFYDEWNGKKVMLYYEDLIINFKKYYTSILNIVNVDKKEHDKLFANLAYHKNACLKQYDKVCGSQSKGKSIFFHSKKLPVNLIKEMDRYAKENKYLYNRYLKRY